MMADRNCESSLRFLCMNVGGSGRTSARKRNCLVSKVVQIWQPHVVLLQECSLSTSNVINFFGLDSDRWDITPGGDARVLWDTTMASRVDRVGDKRVEWLISKCIRRSAELENQVLALWSPRHRSSFVLLRLPGDQSPNLVLITSWHGPKRGKGLNERKRKEIFVAFILLVHKIRVALQSEAKVMSLDVVLAGDFNLRIETAREGLVELNISPGFVIPSYTISKRRLSQSMTSSHCIDYFVISGAQCKVSSLHVDDQNKLIESGASRVDAEFIVENCRHLDHDPVMAITQLSRRGERPQQAKKGGTSASGVSLSHGAKALVQPLVPIASYSTRQRLLVPMTSYSHRQQMQHSLQPNRRQSRANDVSDDNELTRCFDCFCCKACVIL